MNTANISYGKLINIPEDEKKYYNFYYTAENCYVVCNLKKSYNIA